MIGAWLREARRVPHIGVLTVLAAGALALLPGYFWLRRLRPLFADPQFIYDFSFYTEAARRFATDPLALYADAEYLYPPPSVVAFLPTLLAAPTVAYLVWVMVSTALCAVGFWLVLRLYERAQGERLPRALATGLVLIGLASGPVFQNLKYGQVNVLVLLAGVGFLLLLERRALLAALLLALGFWLKLYPLVLAPLALRRWRQSVGGFALGLVGLPLLLLPLVPFRLYEVFVTEQLPHWSGMTSQGALNQSLAGVLTRLTLPPEAALRNLEVPMPTWVQAVGTLAALVIFGGLYLLWLRGRLDRMRTGVLVLAAIPVCSTLGWEHTYLLALPLVFVALLDVRGASRRMRGAAMAATLVLMLPRLPWTLLAALVEHAPRGTVDLLAARYPLATFVLAMLVAWRVRTRHTDAPATSVARASGGT